MNYTHTVTVQLEWEDAVQRTREALAAQGFGILSEINVRATFENKLGVEAADAHHHDGLADGEQDQPDGGPCEHLD